jgi:hypothetical protein
MQARRKTEYMPFIICMKDSPRAVEQVQGRYPHRSWIPHGRSVPPEPLMIPHEPLIAPREPMLTDLELSLWSKLLSLALCVEKTKLLLRALRYHPHAARHHRRQNRAASID